MLFRSDATTHNWYCSWIAQEKKAQLRYLSHNHFFTYSDKLMPKAGAGAGIGAAVGSLKNLILVSTSYFIHPEIFIRKPTRSSKNRRIHLKF